MTHTKGQGLEGSHWEDHIPVLHKEVLDLLAPKEGGRYLDGTLGLAGHSSRILAATNGNAQLLGIDRDQDTLARARERLASYGDNVHAVYSRYSDFDVEMDALGWDLLDGALLDIGVSSMQIDQADRGFSFLLDGPLDMRMDPSGGMPPASTIVNKWSADQLKMIIGKYGEDPMGGRIANAILDARAKAPIETTRELAAIVESAYPAKWRAKARNHPATRTFQALRMAVNGELDELETFLDKIIPRMRPGGRIAIITFHSLEDRLVKRKFRDEAKGCVCPKQIPVCVCGHEPQVSLITRKPVTATKEELAINSRSSSAKLRVAERV